MIPMKVAIFFLVVLSENFLVFLVNGAEFRRNSTTDTCDVHIAGLFALHCSCMKGRQNTSELCGEFRMDGFQEMSAMLFAAEKVNENRSLLPGVTLRVQIGDTCSSVELATETSLNYTIANHLSTGYKCSQANASDERGSVVAIIGARNSDVSRAVTNLVGLFHIPMISYSSTSSSLSGVEYFLRTIPPDIFVAQALVDILKKFNWNYIILLYSDNEYGRFGAEAFNKRLRKGTKKICTAVEEAISRDDPEEERRTWKKMRVHRKKTKVVVVYATDEDFSSFLETGKEEDDPEQYLWLSDELRIGHASNVTSIMGNAISVVPHQHFIGEFADFLYSALNNSNPLKDFASFNKAWFSEYSSSVPLETRAESEVSTNTCLLFRSSLVSFVIDAVYAVAWALHNLSNGSLQCPETGDLLRPIKGVNFRNPWTKNHVSFTENGNPRTVVYDVVSLQHTESGHCFVRIGKWSCNVHDNETCEGQLSLKENLFSSNNSSVSEFLGVCGTICPPGQYKVVDKTFPSCCWHCQVCTGNKYTSTSGRTSYTECGNDEWPNSNHTACLKVQPKIINIAVQPSSAIILTFNVLGIILLFFLFALIIKFRHSRMKIFSERFLCYLLLFGILLSYISSVIVLTDRNKNFCLPMVFLSRIGPTCTTATLLIKTNDVYRRYKKKILKEDPRFLSQGMKIVVVVSLMILDAVLFWLSVNYEGEERKTSTVVYIKTATGNTAYLKCGYLLNIMLAEPFTLLQMSFYWGIILISTQQAYLTRKITDSCHGLRYVFLGCLALLVNSATTPMIYPFTDNRGIEKELIFAVHHTFFAAVAFSCVFIPKLQILVLHPEKDKLHDALSPSVISSMDSVHRSFRRKSGPEMFSEVVPEQ